MNVVKVHGIRCYSLHGCLQEEKIIGGNYEVNVDLTCDFSYSAKSDDLSDTIDYVTVNEIVEKQMNIPYRHLEIPFLEALHRLSYPRQHSLWQD